MEKFRNLLRALGAGLLSVPSLISAQEIKDRIIPKQKDSLNMSVFKNREPAVPAIKLHTATVGFSEKEWYKPSFSSLPSHLYKPLFEKPDYLPVFQTSTNPFTKGEFNVSGVIHSFKYGALLGNGSQQTVFGTGAVNTVGMTYYHQFNPRLWGAVSGNINKISIPHAFNTSWGVDGRLSYRLNDRAVLNVFGSYNQSAFTHGLGYGNYGTSVGIDFSEHFGTEFGVQRFYDPINRRWNTAPVVMPYYRFNDGKKIGFDFDGLIRGILIQTIDKKRWAARLSYDYAELEIIILSFIQGNNGIFT